MRLLRLMESDDSPITIGPMAKGEGYIFIFTREQGERKHRSGTQGNNTMSGGGVLQILHGRAKHEQYTMFRVILA